MPFRKPDLDFIADYIVSEWERRERLPKRRELVAQWDEIDKQVQMKAPLIKISDPRAVRKWLPSFEIPLQANALEVLAADSRSMLFGIDDWYLGHGQLTDEFAERLKETPLITGDSQGVTLGTVDQTTVDMLIHAVIDHNHGMYDFRANWTRLIVDALKYGTYVGRGVIAPPRVMGNTARQKGRKIPYLVPVPIRNIYLDHSLQNLLMEGVSTEPAIIREWWQMAVDIRRAGGEGWIRRAVKKLDDDERGDNAQKKGHVHVLEYEGDLFLPRSQGKDIFLHNWIVTVTTTDERAVVRMRQNKLPFRSYLTGTYQDDDSDTPYGSSPLMKGRPLQKVAAETARRLAQAAILNTEPPVEYAKDDTYLIAQGGPVIAPSAIWEVEKVGNVKIQEIGDPQALFGVLQGLLQLYEDVVGVNDPRRGGATKSHTTATAKEIEASRGVLRTEDFVGDMAAGALRDWLYMHYALARQTMTNPVSVRLDARGEKGFIDISAKELPEVAEFEVLGARGIVAARGRKESFLALTQALAQIDQFAVQLGFKPSNWDEIRKELFARHEVANAERFTTPPEGVSAKTAPGQGIPADNQSLLALTGS